MEGRDNESVGKQDCDGSVISNTVILLHDERRSFAKR